MSIIVASLLLFVVAFFLIEPCCDSKQDKLTGDVLDECKVKPVTECTPAQKRDNFVMYLMMLVLLGVMIWQVVELLGS